jgi:hypothetical protein
VLFYLSFAHKEVGNKGASKKTTSAIKTEPESNNKRGKGLQPTESADSDLSSMKISEVVFRPNVTA